MHKACWLLDNFSSTFIFFELTPQQVFCVQVHSGLLLQQLAKSVCSYICDGHLEISLLANKVEFIICRCGDTTAAKKY